MKKLLNIRIQQVRNGYVVYDGSGFDSSPKYVAQSVGDVQHIIAQVAAEVDESAIAKAAATGKNPILRAAAFAVDREGNKYYPCDSGHAEPGEDRL